MSALKLLFILGFSIIKADQDDCATESKGCAPRQAMFGSVCVCNMTYCDTLPPYVKPTFGNANLYESSDAGARFQKKVLHMSKLLSIPEDKSPFTITINSSKRYQEIIGFGGAFTDAAGINIASLPKKMQNDIIYSYYSRYGSEYNMGRIPIASTDFSTRQYSYDDTDGDFSLENFGLAFEDYLYKIPYIIQAKSLCQDSLFLFGSPWGPPFWMKTNRDMSGNGTLVHQPKYFQTWANYFVKFLQSYASYGLNLWGLTVENEPANGFIPDFPFQCLGFTDQSEKDFVRGYLGPTLEAAGFGVNEIKLMVMDDQRIFLPKFADGVLSDQQTNNYISGLAFHWYLNEIAPASLLDAVHESYPDKFILATEACNGANSNNTVKLGSWRRGEKYARDIIEDLKHYTTGWVDWNLALDEQGGPNRVSNFVDAPIIINATAQEFYKQPTYYVLAHFSKLLPRNSVRIESTLRNASLMLDVVAFQRPDGGIVVHVLNRESKPHTIKINTGDGSFIQNDIPANALQSYVY